MVSRVLCRNDLNLFVVFDAIYEEGSITRAAEVLNVTQPAVSNNIARLREMLDDPLFVRIKTGVSPTPLARDLIGPIRQALQIFEGTFRHLEQFQPLESDRTFHISMGDIAEVTILAPLIEAVRACSSNIKIHNFLLPRDKIPLKLASGEIDFAVEPFMLRDTNLECDRILSDEFVCVVHNSHPAAKSALTVNDYMRLEHIQVSSRPSGAGFIDMELARLKLRRKISVRVQHYLMAPQLMQGSDLCLTMPRSLARRITGEKEFCFLTLPFVVPPLELWLYWHTTAAHSSANRWMRELLSDISKT